MNRRELIAGAGVAALALPAGALPAAATPNAAAVAAAVHRYEKAFAAWDVAYDAKEAADMAFARRVGPEPKGVPVRWNGSGWLDWEEADRQKEKWLADNDRVRAELGLDDIELTVWRCGQELDLARDALLDTPARSMDDLKLKARSVRDDPALAAAVIADILGA